MILIQSKAREQSTPIRAPLWKQRHDIDMLKSGGDMKPVNVIPGGALHRERNNIGDKGIPVVTKRGEKHLELEKEELVLSAEASDKIRKMAVDAETSDEVLEVLGKYVTEEVMYNTNDLSGRYKDLKA